MSSNLSSTAAPAGIAAPSSLAGARGTPAQQLATLIRRELWEHRALWIAPLAIAGIMVLCVLFGTSLHSDLGDRDMPLDAAQKVALLTMSQGALSLPIYLVMIFVVSFYLVDCLYAERRDRSILFWKSLPVSDGLTVTSKLLVGTVVVPLGVFVLNAVTHLVILGVWDPRAAFQHLPNPSAWNTLAWLRTELVLLALLALSTLWYAPVSAYFMLVGAWARRHALMWATLLPLLAPVLERMVLGTHYLWTYVAYRFGMFHIWGVLGLQHQRVFVAMPSEENGNHLDINNFDSLLTDLHFRAAFLYPDLLLGLLVAGLLLYGATRIRRYRDDT